MQVESLPVADLHEDPANVRRHPERNLSAIKASLARFGQQKPVVIDANNVVRAGNGTLVAVRELGWERIVCVRTPLAGSEATAYSIADNRTSELAIWDQDALAGTLRALQAEDFDLEAVGFTDDEIGELYDGLGGRDGDDDGPPAPDPGARSDRAEELQEKWGTALGNLWLIPSLTEAGREHRLLCGDSTRPDDVARLMRGEKAVLVVADPPYGVDFVRGQFLSDPTRRGKSTAPTSIEGDGRKGDEQRFFIRSVFESFVPHVVGGCSVYMFSACLVPGACSFFGLLDAGVKVQIQLVWNKNVHCLGQADYHWKHEICWYGWYDTGPHRWFGGRDKVSVLDCTRVPATLHPNEKPVALIEDMIENSSLRGDLVADPFSGSGTCLVASEIQGRACRAMELDPKFVAVALERLSEMGLTPRRA